MSELSGRWMYRVAGLVTLIMAIFLMGPLVILAVQSFTNASYLSFPPPEYGLRWYGEILSAEDWQDSMTISFVVAIIVMPLSLTIGTMAALALDRGPLRGRRGLYLLLISPMVFPHLVLGLGLFRIALFLNIDDSLLSFVPSHLTITIPFVVITVGASLRSFDRTLEEAARSLGASPFWALWHITLPNIRPGLIAGAVFSFIISFDEFIITFFLATYDLTLPLQIFSTLMFQVEPSIAAVSTLTLMVTALLTALLMTRGQVVSEGQVVR